MHSASDSTAQLNASRRNGQAKLARTAGKRSEAVIDDEELDQERRAAKDEHIGAGEQFERLDAADPHPGHARGDQRAEHDGQEPDRERQRQRREEPDEASSR